MIEEDLPLSSDGTGLRTIDEMKPIEGDEPLDIPYDPILERYEMDQEIIKQANLELRVALSLLGKALNEIGEQVERLNKVANLLK